VLVFWTLVGVHHGVLVYRAPKIGFPVPSDTLWSGAIASVNACGLSVFLTLMKGADGLRGLTGAMALAQMVKRSADRLHGGASMRTGTSRCTVGPEEVVSHTN